MLNLEGIQKIYGSDIVKIRYKGINERLPDDEILKVYRYSESKTVAKAAAKFNMTEGLVRLYRHKARQRNLV